MSYRTQTRKYRSGYTNSLEWTIDVGEEERDVLITYSYIPGAAPILNNDIYGGDPGYGAEIEIISCTDLETGESHIMSRHDEERVIERIEEKETEDFEADYEEWDR